jgi:enediyne biosynthesis protein E4
MASSSSKTKNKTVRGYLSSNDPVVHFGLGNAPGVDLVTVVWPDGKVNILDGVKPNQVLTVNWSDATIPEITPNGPKMFVENSSIISPAFVHQENDFNEYAEQILLPHGFSKAGPFITKADIDADGDEDFFIGGAAGQAGSVYLQDNGKFVQKKSSAFEKDKAFEDAGAAFIDVDGDKDMDLYVASGGSEFADGSDM